MKSKKFNSVWIGLFILMALLAFIAAIFVVGNRRGMFKENMTLNAYFKSSDGVRRGALVKLSGIEIGSVNLVAITPDNNVKIELKVDKEYSQFLRKDSEASIEVEGIMGDKFIAISPGTSQFALLQENDNMSTIEPFSIGTIIQQAQATIDNVEALTEELRLIFEDVRAGKGTIGKLVTDESMYYNLNSATSYVDTTLREAAAQLKNISNSYTGIITSIDNVVGGADSVITTVNTIMSRIKEGEGTIWALFTKNDLHDSLLRAVGSAVQTLDMAGLGVEKFAENMEALKHNFLFKGYFENRGYWDKADFEKEIDNKLQYLKEREALIKKLEQELLEKEKEIKQQIK
jgi:phospholipid/cholesterol/gamma-HCH transport system substrate-binding protein